MDDPETEAAYWKGVAERLAYQVGSQALELAGERTKNDALSRKVVELNAMLVAEGEGATELTETTKSER